MDAKKKATITIIIIGFNEQESAITKQVCNALMIFNPVIGNPKLSHYLHVFLYIHHVLHVRYWKTSGYSGTYLLHSGLR